MLEVVKLKVMFTALYVKRYLIRRLKLNEPATFARDFSLKGSYERTEFGVFLRE